MVKFQVCKSRFSSQNRAKRENIAIRPETGSGSHFEKEIPLVDSSGRNKHFCLNNFFPSGILSELCGNRKWPPPCFMVKNGAKGAKSTCESSKVGRVQGRSDGTRPNPTACVAPIPPSNNPHTSSTRGLSPFHRRIVKKFKNGPHRPLKPPKAEERRQRLEKGTKGCAKPPPAEDT
jgi:hypothetical protein